MERVHASAAAMLALVLLGCTPPPGDPPAASDHLQPIGTPAGAGSGEPNLVSGDDGHLYLSWIEPQATGHALRFAVWDGDTWSAPRTIATGDGWFVNWADFPSLAALADGTLAAHWLVKSAGATYAYDVVLSVSSDGGDTWTEPVRPHKDGTPTEHGFASILPLEDDFLVVWLDGRQTAADPPGPMTLRHARLARDGSVGPTQLLDSRVCDCCPTDARRTGEGALVVYRDRTSDEIRDVFAVRLGDDSWSAPAAVHDDGWLTGGCPVNGPAVDAQGDHVAVAWFTGAEGDPGSVRVAFSADGGRTFGEPDSVDGGRPLGRVDVALLRKDLALVSWLEQFDEGAAILARAITPSGPRASTLTLTRSSVSRQSGFPKAVRHGDDVFLAWTETGEPTRVRSARLSRAAMEILGGDTGD